MIDDTNDKLPQRSNNTKFTRINLNVAAIRIYAGRRLFTCWLDFGLRLELIKTAQATLQPQPED